MVSDSYMRVKLNIGAPEAEALVKAFRPDDETPPKNFNIRTTAKGDSLVVVVRYSGELSDKVLLTFLSVGDEFSRLTEAFMTLLKLVPQ